MAHILLVEDSPEVSLSVREILASAGHTVEDAASGKEALKKLKASRFDAIVSDIWMPEMDGIALLKEIRGAGNEIPVVVISGGAPNAPLTYTAPWPPPSAPTWSCTNPSNAPNSSRPSTTFCRHNESAPRRGRHFFCSP